MKKKTLSILFFLLIITCIECRKTSRGRSSSGRGSSRRTNYNPQPSPTSLSYPQASAPKPTLFGWQEKSAQRSQTSSRQSKPSSHTYPSSQTGLSGQSKPRQNSASQYSGQQTGNNAQQSHSYPASNSLSGNSQQQGSLSGNSASKVGYPQQGNGLSGNTGSAAGYPQQGSGLSGNSGHGAGYPQQGSGLSGSSGAGYPQHGTGLPGNSGHGYPHQNSGSGGAPPAYSAYPSNHGYAGNGVAPPPYPGHGSGNYPYNNFGSNYHHPQAPPPYSNFGSNYGGYGKNSPGYFGNYASNNRGFGGMSRTGTALTGVGIAGAGVGTLLTGLALWNLARSTGNRHHTVIYDNRGQPVAVAPNNGTETTVDPILGDLVNCTLEISNGIASEILAIPCSIATSFTPDADVKDTGVTNNPNDNTTCTVTVVTKTGREFMTPISCAMLLKTAAENNVTEPPISTGQEVGTNRSLDAHVSEPSALQSTVDNFPTNKSLVCNPESGAERDPINPCFTVVGNLTVIPLEIPESTTPSVA